ncbi:MAG: response regulator transcription factor [Magnetospirillum sp.]|nr:response regulator transcription factor [Magnetospirillum sp.]
MEDKPHILVVDDDTRLRELLRKYLADNGYVVTTASDAADARAKLGALAVDLIVLDVMMPGEDGLSLTRSLRERSGPPILLLTAMGEVEARIRGLESGADDYLAKPFEPRELLLRIASILRRVPKPDSLPRPCLGLGAFSWDPARYELRRDGDVVHLTTAESQLMAVLAEAANTAVARDDLAARTGNAANPRAIDVQVTRLRRKLEDDPRNPRYLQTVRGQGYMLRPD